MPWEHYGSPGAERAGARLKEACWLIFPRSRTTGRLLAVVSSHLWAPNSRIQPMALGTRKWGSGTSPPPTNSATRSKSTSLCTGVGLPTCKMRVGTASQAPPPPPLLREARTAGVRWLGGQEEKLTCTSRTLISTRDTNTALPSWLRVQ